MSISIQRKLWNGKVPVCFELASHEVSLKAKSIPQPLYLLVPRVSYLMILQEKIINFFSSFIESEESDKLWFEFSSIPLRWNYPTGLLFDLYCDISQDIPWFITVHFKNFPSDKLLNSICEDALQSSFFSQLKEADFLKHGGEVVSVMTKDETMKLWHGIKTDNFEQFWNVNKKFMDLNSFKNVPVKLYIDNKVLQRRVESSNTTLQGYLKLIDCELFSDDNVRKMKFVLQGLILPLNSDMQWLCENLCYPDNFLHVCIFT